MDLSRVECPNGHIYNPEIYSSCPYCKNINREINFDNKNDDPGKTQMIPEIRINEDDKTRIPQPWDATIPINQNADTGSAESDGTVVIGADEKGNTPVAGWLVCLKGNMYGKSYALFCKQNIIGRDSKADACITGDETISSRQAVIAYDPKTNRFTLVPKTETNTMYLNDEPVYESTKIEDHDVLEMGNSVFVFIAFCGDDFTWDKKA